jgi:hypothetical protein
MTIVDTMAIASSDIRVLAPAVSSVLRIWDKLGLELGEAAVVTDGHQWSRLAALAATWYGALPVLFVTTTPTGPLPGVTTRPSTGSDEEARELAIVLRRRPAVAAVELSGTAGMVDLLLEALPRSSRLMLAGNARERLTIDYYSNVHIKGVRLFSDVLSAEDRGSSEAAVTVRTLRLLARPHVAAACRDALTGR